MSFGFFAYEPSEEEQEKMREAHDRQQMSIEAFKHASQRMFEELSEEHLSTLQTMLHIILSRTNDPMVAQWEGIVSTYLKVKYGICITCNVNHEHEAPRPPEPEKMDEDNREVNLLIDRLDDTHLKEPLFIPSNVREMMDEYHIDDTYEEDSDGLIFKGFACTGIKGMRGGCGMIYPSIDDRRLRGPEECSGCHRKMAQG
jgi:hypothetical protein